jgi:hypothetical protein
MEWQPTGAIFIKKTAVKGAKINIGTVRRKITKQENMMMEKFTCQGFQNSLFMFISCFLCFVFAFCS